VGQFLNPFKTSNLYGILRLTRQHFQLPGKEAKLPVRTSDHDLGRSEIFQEEATRNEKISICSLFSEKKRAEETKEDPNDCKQVEKKQNVSPW
jgi:hypothetical protein